MKNRGTKAELITGFNRATWRALMRGSVLLLLFTHQSWAEFVCRCNPQNEFHYTCSQSVDHSVPEMGMHQESSASHPAHATRKSITPDTCPEAMPHGAQVCCYSMAQGDDKSIATSERYMSGESLTVPISIGFPTTTTSTYSIIHQPHRARPLYLAFSCFLI